ncbi:MAG: hypothetical protein Q9M16_02610 [Mariprofundus sp.]|nr:hypothetical protein [Mariprofundus sp.]
MIRTVFYVPLYIALMVSTALISACAAPDGFIDNGGEQAAPGMIGKDMRLMIKFNDGLSEPQVKHKLADMSKQYHVSFRLIRAMSGEAYVIVLKGVSDAHALDRLLNRIDQRPDIIYIEQDRRMQHFQPSSPSLY